jgi:hypothetical protein
VKMRTRILTLAGLALLASLFLAGCACPPPPCDTDVAEVEAARVKADAAQKELIVKAESQISDLEKQIAKLKAELRDDADYDAMLAKLEDLKCGSGR